MADRTQLGKALAAIDAKIASLQTARALVVELFQRKAKAKGKPRPVGEPKPLKDSAA